MKILTVATFSHPDHFGGAERVITDVAERLVARGHEVTLLTARLDDQLPARELRAGVDVVRYPVRRGSPLVFYRSVWRGVRTALRAGAGAGADVLHLHQLLSGVAALSRGVPLPPVRVLTFHAPYHLEFLARWRQGQEAGRVPLAARAVSRVLARGDRRLVRRADALLVLSEFARRQVDALDRDAALRTRIAPAGVDLQRFRPEGPADVPGLPPGDAPLILTVRRLVARMGLPDLLDAAGQLAERDVPFRLAIAGDGAEREGLQARARDLGLGERVAFLGRVPDELLPALYRAADVFVLPTRSLEGFGMVTAEALASGLPVIATDAGASAEVLADVDGARLVPPVDPPALAAALEGLLTDGAERERVAAAARAHAERRLDWALHLDAFEDAVARGRERAS